MTLKNNRLEKPSTIKWVFNKMGGTGWDNFEIFVMLVGIIVLPVIVPLYGLIQKWDWTCLQYLAVYGLAFDVMSGCLMYNSFCHKRVKFGEGKLMDYVNHALIHMQPLVIASFFNSKLLLFTLVYWLVLYLVYIFLFEPAPKVGKHAPNLIMVFFITCNILLLILVFLTINDVGVLMYGVVNYLVLTPLTVTQFYAPMRSQRLVGVFIVVFMSILNIMVLQPPAGFQWFMPVLYIKIFLGYNARENCLAA
jgi:hypothetical protein